MSVHNITITVNGVEHRAEVEARLLLVHFIRDHLGLTGSHIGCDTTQCGACTLMMDGKAVKSCTVFAVQADSTAVTTIEGIGREGHLHPVQEAFSVHHGLQCGYCTPGMVISAIQLLERYPNADEKQIRDQLEGNICRCTGYHNIVKAVRAVAETV